MTMVNSKNRRFVENRYRELIHYGSIIENIEYDLTLIDNGDFITYRTIEDNKGKYTFKMVNGEVREYCVQKGI